MKSEFSTRIIFLTNKTGRLYGAHTSIIRRRAFLHLIVVVIPSYRLHTFHTAQSVTSLMSKDAQVATLLLTICQISLPNRDLLAIGLLNVSAEDRCSWNKRIDQYPAGFSVLVRVNFAGYLSRCKNPQGTRDHHSSRLISYYGFHAFRTVPRGTDSFRFAKDFLVPALYLLFGVVLFNLSCTVYVAEE